MVTNCIQEMAERGKCEGIIQDAVLIGAPCSGNPVYWQKFTKVVAGRIINGYCKYVIYTLHFRYLQNICLGLRLNLFKPEVQWQSKF